MCYGRMMDINAANSPALTSVQQLRILNNALRLNMWDCRTLGRWYNFDPTLNVQLKMSTQYTLGELDLLIELTSRRGHGMGGVIFLYRGAHALRELVEWCRKSDIPTLTALGNIINYLKQENLGKKVDTPEAHE